ncbi:hypothetical protein ACWGCW_10065 [Streptomyces sp. NPDC054933]
MRVFFLGMRGIGHLATGDLELRIAPATYMEKSGSLIRRASEVV